MNGYCLFAFYGFIIMSFVNDIIIGLVFTAFKLRRPNTAARERALRDPGDNKMEVVLSRGRAYIVAR